MKPWAQGPFELIKHADEHAKAGSDFDRRMALISFDNAIELAIVTYLSLVPMQRENQSFPREQIEKWVKNFNTKLEFLEYLVTSIFCQPMQFERDIIVFYHGLRNDIYHRGIGVVPAENYISGVRAVALWVFSTLFKIDAESLLAQSEETRPVIAKDLQQEGSSSVSLAPDISAQTKFLELFISVRQDVNMLMRITAGEKAAGVSQSGTTEALETLPSQVEMATKYEDVLEQAEALRTRIVEGQSVETSDSKVRDLSNNLAEVSNVVRTEVEDLSAYPKRVHEVEARLLADIPADDNKRAGGEQERWLLAQLLEWHRREDQWAWWEYFRLCELTDHELQEDESALGGLSYVGVVGAVKKSIIHRYKFPPQEHAIDRSSSVHDPRTQRRVGEIVALDVSALTIDIKRSASSSAPHPTALIANDIVDSRVQRDSLLRLGSWVAQNSIDGIGPFRAARDLLLREQPRVSGGPFGALIDEHQPTESARRVALALESSVFPIQGPPGSGKTYTGARMILEFVKRGKRVGITAASHKVISNLLRELCKAANEEGVSVRAIQKLNELDGGGDEEQIVRVETHREIFEALSSGEAQIAAATTWLWAREEMADAVDVLFIDEAGQMSLANVLAASQAARSMVLLGDPQQLDQRRVHPPGAGASGLSHLLHGRSTIGEDQGLFLSESWRLPPNICKFTSEVFYDGRLVSRPENERQRINARGPLDGTGLRFAAVNHSGNQNQSPEEVERILEIVELLLGDGASWTNKKGEVASLRLQDILIVAPYNAQVSALSQRLPATARIGTVDRFQGQEAPVVIYSMTTSTPEDAPRGLEFLYSPNRLNVATSRAQCLTVLVASPALFEAQCKSPRQTELVNAFCRYREMAQLI